MGGKKEREGGEGEKGWKEGYAGVCVCPLPSSGCLVKARNLSRMSGGGGGH